MDVITAQSLADNNLAYREQALYDEMLADDTTTDEIVDVARHTGTTVGSVLDLGCGTGRVLAEVQARGWRATGVDLQPALLDHGRTRSAGLALHAGDIRTVRLGATFDLVLCLGNTLAYLHTEAELAAAFATMAAHAHPGTVLVIATLDRFGRDSERSTCFTSEVLGEVHVDSTTWYDRSAGTLTTVRSWQFSSGRVERDHVLRRVWSGEALLEQATLADFEYVQAPHSPNLTLCAMCR